LVLCKRLLLMLLWMLEMISLHTSELCSCVVVAVRSFQDIVVGDAFAVRC
jgi:hypothetical protein